MSHFGRKPKPEPVYVNVYDLHPHNHIIGAVGLGVYHSGLVVHGTEWTFGSGGGIFNHAPKAAQGARFKCTIKVGEVSASSREVERVVESMRPNWPGDEYSLMTKNCNCFTDALAKELLGHGIPPWINRLSQIGNMCSCLLPQNMANSAPVTDGSAPSGRPSSTQRGAAKPAAPSRFGGDGHRLGGPANPPQVPAAGGGRTLAGPLQSTGQASGAGGTSSRELALQAAMRRVQGQGSGPGAGGGDGYATLGSTEGAEGHVASDHAEDKGIEMASLLPAGSKARR